LLRGEHPLLVFAELSPRCVQVGRAFGGFIPAKTNPADGSNMSASRDLGKIAFFLKVIGSTENIAHRTPCKSSVERRGDPLDRLRQSLRLPNR